MVGSIKNLQMYLKNRNSMTIKTWKLYISDNGTTKSATTALNLPPYNWGEKKQICKLPSLKFENEWIK